LLQSLGMWNPKLLAWVLTEKSILQLGGPPDSSSNLRQHAFFAKCLNRKLDPISSPTTNTAQYECIANGGTLAIADMPEVNQALTDILDDNGQERIIGLRKFYNVDQAKANTVWQNGRTDADFQTGCTNYYGSFNFGGLSEVHMNANHDAYVNGPPSATSLAIACQFLGENLAEGKNASSHSIYSPNHLASNVIILCKYTVGSRFHNMFGRHGKTLLSRDFLLNRDSFINQLAI